MAHPGGRPTLYKPEYDKQAHDHCLLGATDAELAKFFDVSESTLNLWKVEHPKFSEAIKAGKGEADEKVAASLYHRALGYSHDAEKIFLDKAGQIVRADYVEHYPPDPTSMIFWLKNRQKDKWRDKSDHEVTGANGAPLIPILEIVTSDGSETSTGATPKAK